MATNFARFAAVAYGDAGQSDSLKSEGWRQLPSIPKAVLFARGGELVAAFRGTVLTDTQDLADDAALSVGNEATLERFQQARRWVLSLRQTYPRCKLTLTGHSLAGSIGLFCAYATQAVSVSTYNAFCSPAMVGNVATPIANYTKADVYYVLQDTIGATALLLSGPARHAKVVLDSLTAHNLSNWL